MAVIAEKAWSYVLFDNGEDWILTFLIGGVVEIDVSVRLSNDEIAMIKADSTYVEILLASIKKNRSAFADREINPPVWPKKA